MRQEGAMEVRREAEWDGADTEWRYPPARWRLLPALLFRERLSHGLWRERQSRERHEEDTAHGHRGVTQG